MKLSAEISKYPLTENYLEPIQKFLEQLSHYQQLTIVTNTLSTQIFGDYDEVMQAIQACIKFSFEYYGTVVFVCKFLHGDFRP